MSTLRIALGVSMVVACVGGLAAPARARELSFEERLDYQARIEQVLWNHSVWPQQNPGPKPPLPAVLSEADMRRKVEDTLLESEALARFWQRPIEAGQLQAEIDRMAAGSQQPDVLRQLFAALDDDPQVVAECLARPVLVQRLIRSWFARDSRIHAGTRTAAVAAYEGCDSAAGLKRAGGEYSETEVVEALPAANNEAPEPRLNRTALDPNAWRSLLVELSAGFGRRGSRYPAVPKDARGMTAESDRLHDELPVGRLTSLQEEDDAFVARAVIEKTPHGLRVATARWPKRDFDSWWVEARRAYTVNAALAGAAIAAPAQSEFSLPAVAAVSCTSDTWTSTKVEVPDPREDHVAVWTGSEMIVWGGANGAYIGTGARYTPATDSWVPVPTAAASPSPRSGAVAVWSGTEMIVWGGTNGSYLNTGGRFKPSTNTWTATSTGANVPSARSDQSAVWTGTQMIVWGGYDDTFLNSGGVYTPATDAWTAVSTGANVPAGRYAHTAVWSTSTSEMLIWGGEDSTFTPVNTGGRYKPSTNTWQATSTGSGCPAAVANHSAVWSGTEMIVWGGTPDFLSDTDAGGRYNPSTNAWTATTTSGAPAARASQQAVWTGTVMIVWGGYSDADGSVRNTGGRYTPSTNTWASTSTGANVPSARAGHTAAWTGTEMIVWGGYDGSAPAFQTNTGGRYNPASDSWVATGTGVNVPAARSLHAAVWTGTQMIVWGGDGGLRGLLNTGGRYTSATDSWAPISTGTNVPTAREYHTAIWSGTTMVVWGGLNGSTAVNSGGRYNPSTNAWTQTSTTGSVPPARQKHTAVWTGTRMIVWGGTAGSTFSSGGAYDPVADSWTATSTGANVPAGRFFHTAVWTGSTMIVWGGSSGATFLNSGGEYTPSTDSWVATASGANTPTARVQHSAVWTGTEMIIWGGYTPPYLNSGARYNPVSRTWTPTSTGAGVPSVRSTHSALYMAEEMIIWGGFSGSSLNNGARYNPGTDAWLALTGTGAPPGRRYFTGIDTSPADGRMIVWGGDPITETGGLYCTRCVAVPWYQDVDGDGHGNPGVTTSACVAPVGYVAAGDDCNDGDSTVWRVPPEVTGLRVAKVAPNTARLTWDSQAAVSGSATTSDVVTGFVDAVVSTGSFSAASCLAGHVVPAQYDDTRANPPAAKCWYYIVRGTTSCGKGSYGNSSLGADPRDALDASGPCP